jgi:hypothetical protein
MAADVKLRWRSNIQREGKNGWHVSNMEFLGFVIR